MFIVYHTNLIAHNVTLFKVFAVKYGLVIGLFVLFDMFILKEQ